MSLEPPRFIYGEYQSDEFKQIKEETIKKIALKFLTPRLALGVSMRDVINMKDVYGIELSGTYDPIPKDY